MDQIRNRREIIDRKVLNDRLAALARDLPWESPELRPRALEILKEVLAAGRAEVRARFEAGVSGTLTVQSLSFLVDQIIRAIYDLATTRVYRPSTATAGERLSVVAVGGYGRGELAPFSDVDLLFLLPYKQTPWGEQVVEFILYLLWDLGLKVGHATRSVDDCIRLAKSDITIRTALLEARYVWGDQSLEQELRLRFRKEVVAGTGPAYLEAKLAERDERHQHMGDSRYVVEPNIKEGKGGLRDLHTLFWIAKYLYPIDSIADLVEQEVLSPAEYRRFVNAQAFLWTVRCHLHYWANRPEERLTFDAQPELARSMGYADRPGSRGVERFMKHYFLVAKEVGDLTRIFCAALEEQHKRRRRFRLPRFSALRKKGKVPAGFEIEGGRLGITAETIFAKDPVNILRLFHIAEERGLDIHPKALRLVRRNLKLVDAKLRASPEANRLFLDMLTSRHDPETTLRRLNEAGVFGRFIPDFGRVVAQMQYDMYHVYTVDEHTIRAIGLLAKFEAGTLVDEHPVESHVVHQVSSRRVLYLATLLHDVAKGRGGDHSILGAKVAERLCPRLGLTAAETETVAWLVRWHLLMSSTAFKRDIADPKTVADFAKAVETEDRVRLLLLLTAVDIRAVGPGVWNGWKGQLLRELYQKTLDFLTGASVGADEPRVEAARAALRAGLADLPADEVEAYLHRHYPAYWLTTEPETQLRHARLVCVAERKHRALSLETRADTANAVTELVLYTADHPGLFARVAGAIAVSGGNIVDARIFTTSDGMALDTFFIQGADGKAIERPEYIQRLKAAVERTLSGALRPHRVFAEAKPAKIGRALSVPPRVLIDNNASGTATVIEVQGRDRRGLLHDLTYALFRLSLSITLARIATYGERAVDVFYVKDLFGHKVTNKMRLVAIEDQLIEILTPPQERQEAAKAEPAAAKAEPRVRRKAKPKGERAAGSADQA